MVCLFKVPISVDGINFVKASIGISLFCEHLPQIIVQFYVVRSTDEKWSQYLLMATLLDIDIILIRKSKCMDHVAYDK